jgi:LuxR family maltose regulon positive regulatory protein
MISEELLQTKLQIPRRRTPAVARSRLIARLNSGIENKLILISAPAGFGKTTLLTEWVASSQCPSTWLTLDEHDNELALFLTYFVAALQKVKASLGDAAPGLFNPPEQFPLKSITILINEINSIPGDFILILDDYQTIKNQSIHKALSFLIDNLPANMHPVITSRFDPPLNLARLRSRGQLTELRADDLRFTSEETAEFLNRVMELNLNSEELALLDTRSEGWIAGLQMAALTLKGKTDTAGFIKAFSRSRRDMLDFLFEEVFEQQTADVQSFLQQTSILDRLGPSLCDAVTERHDSDQILEKIERANLFIFPLDDELRWYRYHPLFKDLLQHSLSSTHPEMLLVLHRRASEWYEREGLFPLAITHALEAQDYDRAARLIERRAGEILLQGEFTTYLGWMDSFPQYIIQMYPILILHRILAETVAMGLPLEDVEARLQEVEKLDPQSHFIKGVGLVIRAVALGNQGDLSQNSELCRKALKLIPAESTFWRGIAISGLRQYWLLEGGVPAVPTAIRLYNDAIETGQKIGNVFIRVVAQRRLAEAYMAAGRLHQAHDYCQEILNVAVDRQGQLLPLASLGLFGLGMLHREWNELDKALNYLKQGMTLESGKLGRWQVDGIIELARTRQAMGELEGASEYLRKARQLLGRFPRYRSHESIIEAYEISLALAQGDMEKVSTWVKEFDPVGLAGSFGIEGEIPIYIPRYPARELQLLTLVRAYLAQNKPAEALKLLDALIKAAEKLGRAGIMVEARILSALAYKALGEMEEALSNLKVTLQAAEPEGYLRLFLDAGPAISSLIYEAVRQGITPAYTHRLIAAFPVSEFAPQRADKSIKMEEPLSDRELSVLTLIAQGLSNKEIGERLHIETRTVKWHASNILGKLGVHNRTEAVAKARELGILKEDADHRSRNKTI